MPVFFMDLLNAVVIPLVANAKHQAKTKRQASEPALADRRAENCHAAPILTKI